MSNGYFYMQSDWTESPCFTGADDRYAWVWLIGSAVFKDTVIGIGGKQIPLKRGQCCFSIRFLSEKWCTTPMRTRTILETFKNWGMISTIPSKYGDKYGTVITICNYDKYQDKKKGKNKDANKDSTSIPASTQQGLNTKKKEYNKQEESKQEIERASAMDFPEWFPAKDFQDWLDMRKAMKAIPTPRAVELAVADLTKWRAAGHDPAKIIQTSIMNNWKGLFEPKPSSRYPQAQTTQRADGSRAATRPAGAVL